ncbi:MAG: hypothetical protein ACK52J_04860 [bacterium]
MNTGLSAVFLVGGITKVLLNLKNEQPLALKIESGDLLIMSGFSR